MLWFPTLLDNSLLFQEDLDDYFPWAWSSDAKNAWRYVSASIYQK